jgi:hypothetical protein
MTVDLLLKRLRRGALDLEPEFQRRAGIWNEATQSRLIESLLLNIPLPTIYAAEDSDSDSWVVIDGVQRLTSIARFVDSVPENMGPLFLNGLEYLHRYRGLNFHGLPESFRTRIEETELVVHLIKKGTPEEVKFNIFARINTGGKPLSLQELRHALIPGRARELLATLADSPAFLDATVRSVSPNRMSDREMVLRFLAFRMTSPESYRGGDLNKFLTIAMHDLNDLDVGALKALEADFDRSMAAAVTIFGEHAFRKVYRGKRRRLPVNKALFEATAVGLAALDAEHLRKLGDLRFRVLEQYMDLMGDPDFYVSISSGTGDTGKVGRRFGEMRRLFDSVVLG